MYLAELQDITKTFGAVKANDRVTVRIRKGEIHALVGENGAGKSTLMKILYGMYAPDAGRISVDGREVRMTSPRKAISLGIGMLHQHFMLIPTFTVTENIILGTEPGGRFGSLNMRDAEREIDRLSETYRLQVDSRAKIDSLSVGLQQRVEILKILYRKAELLILDEPTPVLTPQEVEEFFGTIRLLKSQGKTVILITHKLSEVISISDRVTVMRHGSVAGEVETRSTNVRELARMMVGDEAGAPAEKTSSRTPDPRVIIRNLSAMNERNLPVVRDVSLSIAGGEILGIAAVEGNGQSDLVHVLAGLRPASAGSVEIGGIHLLPGSREIAVAHIPEDRLKFGIIVEFSMAENLILGRHRERLFSRHSLLRQKAIDEYSEWIIREYNVRPPDARLPAGSLSGGNQQKVVIGRELSKGTEFIIACQPTRGLDIRAIDFVHRAMIRERNLGRAILLVSSDLSELLSLSDRIVVMYEGRITGSFRSSGTSERELGLYMTGSQKQEAAALN
ncbi:MAG TPA: ABC transporter ATP-binding protein [Bacteroidota bacterium]